MLVTHRRHPTIGITIGDAAGIGPEIVVRALSKREVLTSFRCVMIGDLAHLRNVAAAHNADLKLIELSADKVPEPGTVEVYDLENLPEHFETGVDSEVTGKAAADNLIAAVRLWKDGKIDAVATAPISKKAIGMAGFDYPGHTEFLAELTDTTEFAMSFFADKLRVVLLSTHLPLVAAISSITEDRLTQLIRFTDREMFRLLRKPVAIAVAGLNPHASEGGMFGTEEAEIVGPSVEKCRAAGINVSGPYSPDTIFLRGFRGEFDACIALYHDQATIAVKSISFGSGVNVTLGLPLIRTSVDHGTAYDIVGTGKADPSSMLAAIELAETLAGNAITHPGFC